MWSADVTHSSCITLVLLNRLTRTLTALHMRRTSGSTTTVGHSANKQLPRVSGKSQDGARGTGVYPSNQVAPRFGFRNDVVALSRRLGHQKPWLRSIDRLSVCIISSVNREHVKGAMLKSVDRSSTR